MFSPDLSKMFDPQTMSRTMQQMFDMSGAFSSSKSGMDSFKQLSFIWTECYSTCTEKQSRMIQSAMEDSVECLRDLSSCKGVEDYMGKQAEWSRKFTEKCQTNAQDIASCVQQGSTKCTDVIGKLVSQNTEWAKTMGATMGTTMPTGATK